MHGFSSLRGGVETYLLSYCGMILRTHKDINFDFVVYGGVPDFVQPLIEAGCHFYKVTPRTSNLIENYRQLASLIDKGSFDLLWFNANTLSDITLFKIANDRGLKTIVHSHNSRLMGNRLNALLHYVHRPYVEKHVDMVTACSGDAACFMYSDELCASSRCRVLPNAIDCDVYRFSPVDRERIRAKLSLDGRFVVGNVGRFAVEKNHAFLLDVFKEINSARPEAMLILLGAGPEERNIRQKIEMLDLQQNVLMLGSVPDTFRYYSAMDCLVFPSIFEGMPLTLLEAQANGLRCVASDRIPSESFITNDCIKMPLDSSPAEWANVCLKGACDVSKRISSADVLLKGGHDVSISSEELLRLFKDAFLL